MKKKTKYLLSVSSVFRQDTKLTIHATYQRWPKARLSECIHKRKVTEYRKRELWTNAKMNVPIWSKHQADTTGGTYENPQRNHTRQNVQTQTTIEQFTNNSNTPYCLQQNTRHMYTTTNNWCKESYSIRVSLSGPTHALPEEYGGQHTSRIKQTDSNSNLTI